MSCPAARRCRTEQARPSKGRTVRDGDRISFVREIMEAVDTFLHEYERERGPLPGPFERAAVASYLLGVMRTNLDAVWDGLAASRVFGKADPRALFAEVAPQNLGSDAALQDEVNHELAARGWGR